MKKNFLAIAVSAFAIAIALASCDKPFVYTPGEAEDVSKTYVGAVISTGRAIEAAGEDVEVPFLRNTKAGALEVTLFLEDTTGIFSLANPTITFADGDSVAVAKVSYDYADLEMDVTYNITVGIASEEVISEYIPSTFPLAIIKAWENLGIAQFYDDWWVGGPFEKTLLKSPDGTETYRLVAPWTAEEVEAGGLEPGDGMPYLEFKIDSDGFITYGPKLNLGFYYGGRTCHNWFPSAVGDAEGYAANLMVADKVAQFTWYPVMNEGKTWWGISSVAYLSFPGGPDLATLLGL
ncbi:MAG: hypothetical protein IKS71_05095 [Bacteroidales bacterium]|nr:hypothetical protein [Bacteroidales bacterium]